MNGLATIGDNFMYAFQRFFAFLPSLLGALILLIVGWLVAKIVAKIVEKALVALGLERAAQSSSVAQFVKRSGSTRTTSQIVAQLTKWFIFLMFVQGASDILAMPQLTNIVSRIVLFLPNIAVALAIIVVTSLVADFVEKLVRASTSEMGLGSPDMLAGIAKYCLLGFGVIAAIGQLGIANAVANTLLIGFVGAIALAVGLAFGLGGRNVAANITESWYEQGKRSVTQSRARTAENNVLRMPEGNRRDAL